MTTRCKTCGQTTKDVRSNADHNRLFAIIEAAFKHWPETSNFQPDNSEHLRSWLICKAGPEFRTVTTMEAPEADEALKERIQELVEDQNTHCGWRGAVLYKVQPKSMKFEKLGQRAFGQLRDAICEVIEQEVGVPAEKLMRESEAAA